MSKPIERYRRVFAVPALRRALLLGLLVRMPIFTGSIILTIHVVATLHRSYGAAGLVSGAATVAIAVSGPWRGRLLDRMGLRRVVVPSIVVAAVCWSVAPFVDYWPLLGLAALAGLFVIPSFSIIRQAVLAAVPEEDRRTALSLDASMVELSFMVGPAAGVWAATQWPTSWVLFSVEMAGVAAGIFLWVVNPPLYELDEAAESAGERGQHLPRSAWFRGRFLAICTAAAAGTVVLGGTDIGIVAALRSFGAQPSIGIVLSVWGFGSLLGGLVYGGLHRSVPAFALLAALAVVTVPMALASGVASLAVLAFVAGLLCAPTITATVDEISRVVPGAARGEAMGWHGSFMTAGFALGAPGAGVAIDRFGYAGGFVVVSALGFAVALVVAGVTLRRGSAPGSEPGLVESAPAPAELLT
ncbi:MAG TPA: MFS transporter [Dermatophilaceae bacterium]|jgi:predicted MFS family arabinose efflux permease|nr:MFS transporter [Dermatophilaceae bacterium]